MDQNKNGDRRFFFFFSFLYASMDSIVSVCTRFSLSLNLNKIYSFLKPRKELFKFALSHSAKCKPFFPQNPNKPNVKTQWNPKPKPKSKRRIRSNGPCKTSRSANHSAKESSVESISPEKPKWTYISHFLFDF